jgi:hypothetical protein
MPADIFPFDLVIIIDELELDRYITSAFIKRFDFAKEIVDFAMAKKAIEFLQENIKKLEKLRFLILVEIRMSKMDSFEFLDKMNSIFHPLKENGCLVICSSFHDNHFYKGVKNNPLVKKIIDKPLNKVKLEEIKNSCINT